MPIINIKIILSRTIVNFFIKNKLLHFTGVILLFLKLTRAPKLKFAMVTELPFVYSIHQKLSILMLFTLKNLLMHHHFVNVSCFFNYLHSLLQLHLFVT